MKKMINSIYAHKSALEQLEDYKTLVALALAKLPKDFIWDVVKVNLKEASVSFIRSSDWDTADEPEVGDSIKVHLNGNLVFTKAKGQIYHHKHEFVNDDYPGFDLEKSRQRSEWIKNNIPKEVKSKIGYRKFWEHLIADKTEF